MSNKEQEKYISVHVK